MAGSPEIDGAAELKNPGAASPVPPMPAIKSFEWGDWPCLLIDDRHMSVGWQNRAEKKGGPCYLVGRRIAFDAATKVVERFPFTEAGWSKAWRFLVRQDKTLAARIRKELADRVAAEKARVELAQLDEAALINVLAVTYVGGYSAEAGGPETDSAALGLSLTVGFLYDLRFLSDRLLITPPRSTDPLFDVPYSELEEFEVGGPGIVSRMSRQAQAGLAFLLGTTGAIIAWADTKIQTLIRIQAPGCELHFLCTTVPPDSLRVQLSRPLGAIRDARAGTGASGAQQAHKTAEAVGELSRLAGLLEAGLLTREEFDRLKAQLLAGT